MGFFGGGGGAGGIGGSTGATDNAILRADGTGAATLQNSAIVIEDAISSFSCTGVASTDIITAVGHNFTTNQYVRFLSLTGGGGLATSTNYFVRDISGDTFKVSTSSGGSAVNFTTDITAGIVVAGGNTLVQIANNHSETNSSVVISTKASGAFILGPKPDGTTSGGNARGDRAICMVIGRDNAAQVASGNDSTAIGHKATASGNLGCTAVGGSQNTANASYASAFGGLGNLSSGVASCVIGGQDNEVSGARSLAVAGYGSLANRPYINTHATLYFSAKGDAQRFWTTVRNKTSNNTAVELLEPSQPARPLAVPSGKTIAFFVNIAASTSGGEFANMYMRQGIIANRGGTTALRGTIQTVGTDIEGISGADVTVEADDTNDALKISFTGVAPVTGCTISAATDVISKTAHGFSNNDDIIFTSLTGGVGLTLNTVTYWVIDATADTFKVSTTRGGSAVNITTNYTDATAARLFRVVASVDAVEIGHGT